MAYLFSFNLLHLDFKSGPREYIEFLLKNVSQLSKQEIENKLEAYLPWNYNSSSIKQVEA